MNDSIPKKDFSTHYMKDYIIARILAHPRGSLISNGKVRRQKGLKDYPSAMLSTSTFQEWNGMTVTLWKHLSFSVCGKLPHFFALSPMSWNRKLCLIMARNSSYTTLSTSTLWVIPVTSFPAQARRMLQKLFWLRHSPQ